MDGRDEVLNVAETAELLLGDSVEGLMNGCKASRHAGGTDDFSVIVLSRTI
jgi:hypothetical protein